MSTYIQSSEDGNHGRESPMLALREPLPESYSSETPILPGNVMMYMNFASSSAGKYPDSVSIPSARVHDSNVVSHQELVSSFSWRDGRNHEMMLMDQMDSSSSRGVSLSLGSDIPPAGIQFDSNTGFSSFLNPNKSRSGECMVPGFHGSHLDSMKADVSYGIGNFSRAITDSKYLKSAQQLLDEIVNVGKALKQRSFRNELMDDLKRIDGESKKVISSNEQESNELSAAEKQEMQNRMTKLISMQDEVDRRYKQYYHQMQIVVSAFDVVSGCGAATPYTALALQTISRHFRCLKNAINDQIKETQRSLGEADSSSNSKGVGISRLRFVDQQLRQQRALQQAGMMQQHTWRPQRGLPENSVTVLRAWLFEHFLHPYPKDSDKIMLARQTGLTRGQVSNWFINARVRLWKPMVEEMYKEEAGDAEIESNSSSETAPKNTNNSKMASEEDINQSSIAGTSNDSEEFQNMMAQINHRERLMAAAYQVPPKFGVSLTLGLQHSEDGSLPPMGSNGGGGGGGVGPETVDFDCLDSGDRQQRFGDLLHDFVA